MPLYEPSDSRCESPLTMISAFASTAHSRILLSAGSSLIKLIDIAATYFQFLAWLFHARCLPLRDSLRMQGILHKKKSLPISVFDQYRLLPLHGETPSVSCVLASQPCQSPTEDFSETKYLLLTYSSVLDSFCIKIYNLCMMSRKNKT